MSIEENKAIANKVINAVSEGNWDYINEVYADDVVIWIAGSLPGLSGTHGKEFLTPIAENQPIQFPNGMSLTAKSLIAEGDRVAIECESLGQHANGKTYNNHYHVLMVIKDGQVKEWKEYMDTMHAQEILLSA